ncbi:MAG TPA: T9SS type A sorting domain-containing protein, partial [Bacteroidia bacterium]
TSTSGNTSAGTVTSGLVTSFSPFTLASITPIALPVTLMDFKAWWNEINVSLEWTTESETNNDFFTVERSLDGISFWEVTRVKGAGNSVTQLNYHAIDEKAPPGVVYYRLKQTDFDGKFSYSPVVAVNVPFINEFSITYVNYSDDGVDCYLSSSTGEPLRAELLDATGKIIYSAPVVANTEGKIHLGSLALVSGIYLLKLSSGKGVTTRKVRVTK